MDTCDVIIYLEKTALLGFAPNFGISEFRFLSSLLAICGSFFALGWHFFLWLPTTFVICDSLFHALDPLLNILHRWQLGVPVLPADYW